MRIRYLTCKCCGARLNIDKLDTTSKCPYCKTQFIVESDESIAYQNEKGKLRARSEMNYTRTIEVDPDDIDMLEELEELGIDPDDIDPDDLAFMNVDGPVKVTYSLEHKYRDEVLKNRPPDMFLYGSVYKPFYVPPEKTLGDKIDEFYEKNKLTIIFIGIGSFIMSAFIIAMIIVQLILK